MALPYYHLCLVPGLQPKRRLSDSVLRRDVALREKEKIHSSCNRSTWRPRGREWRQPGPSRLHLIELLLSSDRKKQSDGSSSEFPACTAVSTLLCVFFCIITLRRAKSSPAVRNVRYLWTSSSNGAEPPNCQVSSLKSGCLQMEDVVLERGEVPVVPLS